MPQISIPLTELSVGGRDLPLAYGVLRVKRDDPEPGVEGLRSWTVDVTLESAQWLDLGDAADVVMEEANGARYTGTAFVSDTNGTRVTLRGSGSLDPSPL